MKTRVRWRIFGLVIVLTLSVVILASTIALPQQFFVNGANSDWTLTVTASNTNNTLAVNTNQTFTPFDLVHITANITFAKVPQPNVEAVFKIVGPANATNPNTIIRTAVTDQNGLAKISFRLPKDNTAENPTLGTWKINCTAGILDRTLKSDCTIKVDWPISIQSIKLFDQNGTESYSFSRNQSPTVQISLFNNGSQPINSTLIINAIDFAGTQNNLSNITQTLSSLQTNIVKSDFLISNNYSIGQARIDSNVYSIIQGQTIQFSLSKNFTIVGTPSNSTEPPTNETIPEPSTEYHDLALIQAGLSTNQAVQGDIVNFTAIVLNKGNFSEQAKVHFICGHTETGSSTIQLLGNESRVVSYQLNTSSINPGSYQVTIHLDAVVGENQTSDNDKTAGTITIIAAQEPTTASSSISLYVLTLFIVGSTTFSILSFLKWRRNKTPITKVPTIMSTEDEEEFDRQKMPIYRIPIYQPEKTVTAKEITYSSVLPTLSTEETASTETLAPPVLPSKDQSEQDLEQIGKDRLTDELEQFKLKSLELLPLSVKAIDLSIQKINLLQNSKITSKRLRLEFEEIERIIDLQTESIENELDRLKQSAEKLRSLSKSKERNKDQTQSKEEKKQQETTTGTIAT